jgi:NitT/TauT family transport system permease protein
MSRSWRKSIGSALPPLLLLVAVIAVWQAAVSGMNIPLYLLPGPGSVATAAWKNADKLADAMLITAAAAGTGFIASLCAGVLVALVFSQSSVIRSSCYPYAIFLQTVPIVAIAPLIITWFGYGLQSVMIVAGIISLFPIITNATTGMLAVDPSSLDLFRLYGASRWQILLKLRLPNSVPLIVTGAKTSAGLAVVGAIVGEFFVGAGMGRFGLGYLIRQKLELLKTAELFAAVGASTLLGVGIFAIVSAAGFAIQTRWYNPPTRDS